MRCRFQDLSENACEWQKADVLPDIAHLTLEIGKVLKLLLQSLVVSNLVAKLWQLLGHPLLVLGQSGILWDSLGVFVAMSGYVWLCVQFAPSACRNQSRIETQHKEIQRAQLRMTEDDTSSSSSTFKTLCYIPFGIGKLQSWTLGVCMLPYLQQSVPFGGTSLHPSWQVPFAWIGASRWNPQR
jgi:hypothetical protein